MRVMCTVHPLKESDQWCKLRRYRGHSPTIADCLVAVQDYNIFMRDVDRSDQLITLYNGVWRTKKLWKRLVYHDLETQLLNTFMLYKAIINRKGPFLRFKLQLVDQLTRGRSFRKGRCRPYVYPVTTRIDRSRGHMLNYRESTKLHCKVCSRKLQEAGFLSDRTTKVTTYCNICEVTLCSMPKRQCF